MVERDGVTEVVVPVTLHGRPLATGAPSVGAAAFFVQVLGESPSVSHDAWVFDVRGPLGAPHLVAATVAARCEALAATAGPGSLGPCVLAGAAP
jgi:hypothetical protein